MTTATQFHPTPPNSSGPIHAISRIHHIHYIYRLIVTLTLITGKMRRLHEQRVAATRLEEGMGSMKTDPLSPEARRDVQRFFEIRPLNQNKLVEDKVRDVVMPTVALAPK